MTFAERVSHALSNVPHKMGCPWMHNANCVCDREARIAALVAQAIYATWRVYEPYAPDFGDVAEDAALHVLEGGSA